MKKLILSTLAVLAAMGLHAQLLKVESMERVRLPQGVRAEQAILSPDGNSIALSDLDGSLKVVDRRSGTARTISRTGSMMDLAFTADGIVFREASTDGQRRRHVAVKSYRLSDGRTTELVAPTAPYWLWNPAACMPPATQCRLKPYARFRASITDFCISTTAARAQLCARSAPTA